MSKKIAVFPGSFNPIHIGHSAIANYVVAFTDTDELWLVVSPQNPFKKTSELADFEHRFESVRIAVEFSGLPIVVSDIENRLAKPSYTINMLDGISRLHPDYDISLLMGSDNIPRFGEWKDHEKILEKYRLMVYPRLGFDVTEQAAKYGAKLIDAPVIEVSSTFIREALNKKLNVKAFMPPGVYEYICRNKLYIK